MHVEQVEVHLSILNGVDVLKLTHHWHFCQIINYI